MYDERTCRYALNRIFGFRPAAAHALIGHFGSAAGVFSADRHSLPPGMADLFTGNGGISDRSYEEAHAGLQSVEQSGTRFVCDNEPGYPGLLRECADRPVGIFVRSRSPVTDIFPDDRIFVAVVGTRDISLYGQEWCRKLVGAIADSGEAVTVVSGLAIGTDITAHRTALEKGIPTVAVMPTGPDAVYPYRHRKDAADIESSPGSALVTDYPPGTAPLPINFMRRNRIIAGLSKATVLIESRIRGGGMMTARLAFSYNRDVLALPGRIDDERSAGCNLLLRERIADPVISCASLTDSLGLHRSAPQEKESTDDRKEIGKKYASRLCGEDLDRISEILLTIRGNRGTDIESIAETCGMSYRKALELTMLLEADGMISVDLMQRCTIKIK